MVVSYYWDITRIVSLWTVLSRFVTIYVGLSGLNELAESQDLFVETQSIDDGTHQPTPEFSGCGPSRVGIKESHRVAKGVYKKCAEL